MDVFPSVDIERLSSAKLERKKYDHDCVSAVVNSGKAGRQLVYRITPSKKVI